MKIISALFMSLICIQLYACNKTSEVEREDNSNNVNTDSMKLKITIGANVFTATLYNNATVTEFKARLPMTIKMNELNGNESISIYQMIFLPMHPTPEPYKPAI
jgi:hypothetical protein